MIELKGTHGTCRSIAIKIQDEGFNMSEGRIGTGIYFWKDNRHAKELAIAWFKCKKSRGDFNSKSDNRCAVIHATITVKNKSEILDLEKEEIKEFTDKLLEEGFLQADDPDTEELCAFFDFVIGYFENEKKREFPVIKGKTAPPMRYCNYPIKILGIPFNYLVRKEQVITNTRFEGIAL